MRGGRRGLFVSGVSATVTRRNDRENDLSAFRPYTEIMEFRTIFNRVIFFLHYFSMETGDGEARIIAILLLRLAHDCVIQY